MLPIKKLYIDSRDQTPDSISDSNFKIDLPQVMQMPPNSVFFITDVSVPHVWTTVEQGFNDKLYVWVTNTTLPIEPSNFQYYVITMPYGNYTAASLASVLQITLNAAVSSNMFTCRNTSGANDLQIAINTPNLSVVFYSDAYIIATPGLSQLQWLGGSLMTTNTSTIGSMNDLIKNYTNKVLNSTTPYNIDFVNLQPINNVYITSPTLGSYDTLATFSNNVIKKIPVTADYGYMIVDQFIASNDFLDCSKQTFKTLEFHLGDGRGREINIHGSHISFSIVFNKWSEDT